MLRILLEKPANEAERFREGMERNCKEDPVGGGDGRHPTREAVNPKTECGSLREHLRRRRRECLDLS